MINVNYYFKIKVTYKYKFSALNDFKKDTADYEIVLNHTKNSSFNDIEDEACNIAKDLCKETYSDLPYYEYAGLTICEKRIIYIKK